MKCGSQIFLPLASILSEITRVLRRRSFAWAFVAAALLYGNGRPVLGQDTAAIGSAQATPSPTPAAAFTERPTAEEVEVEPTPLPGTTPTPPALVEATPTPTPTPVVQIPAPIIPMQAGTTPGSLISRIPTEPGLPGPASAVPSGISLRSADYLPLTISLSLHQGYDENFRTMQSGSGSWFTNPAGSLVYNLPGTITQIALYAGSSFTYYWQGNSNGGGGFGSQRNDINSYVRSIISHSVSERFKLELTLYATYRSEPDLSSNVGFENRQGNYFNTLDSLAATYHWSPRFFTVTTDKFLLVDYGNSSQGGTSQNRIDNTIDQEFKYDLLHRGNTAVLEYRFEISDYQDSSLNSLSNVFLVGFDQEFSPQFTAKVRAGATIRSFSSDGSQVTPHFEGSLAYAGAHNSLLSWKTSYGTENAEEAGISNQVTLRSGLEFRYGLTARITAILSAYYAHSTNQGTAPGGSGATAGSNGNSGPNANNGPNGSRDTYDVFVNGRYTINPRWACDLGIEYSGENSDNSANSANNYTRLRYSGGFTYKF